MARWTTDAVKINFTRYVSQTISIMSETQFNTLSILSDWLYHSPLIRLRQRVDTTHTYCTLTHTHTHPGH